MPSKETQKISNVTILTEDGFVPEAVLLIEDGRIAYLGEDQGQACAQVFDGRGAMLVPGFLDLHVHGGAGWDFMDKSVEAVQAICRFHAAHGTTGLLATTMTAPMEETVEVIRFYNHLPDTGGAAVLGLHLEGPFINKAFKGAQKEEWIEPAHIENVQRILETAKPGWIKQITLAPELVEDDRVFDLLRERGVIIAAGHTALDYQGGLCCLQKGVSHATHLGNAMKGFHHRDPGIIGLVMERPELTFDLIADGIHVAPAFIRLLTRICSPEQIMLITDAMRAAGLQDGVYELGGQEVTVKGNEARLAGGVLAGSLLTLDAALANLMRFAGMPLEQAIRHVTLNQAEKLGIADRKGSIAPGKDADLVLLSDDLRVLATWVEGRLVYQAR
ncbi:N-acetylglucosamine-6-phosphate deacetylase [Brevibacillus sp. SYP-B805]|uniref:N-acetylglucosamine-6-phosphate deacetylase n=1 Tax=Brevibacillus sp. SYP-B805 TaxID=1578199 RepID=UPI0013ED7BE5|nr:N-acetylglucosamine-6-phosphate deacetylase [Brevibacillus sp. SYP-B805]NGQ94889.1 N-acetylglucosamine-6-phosphate deacetylase [Brevibacillus sp. SYP-B805]